MPFQKKNVPWNKNLNKKIDKRLRNIGIKIKKTIKRKIKSGDFILSGCAKKSKEHPELQNGNRNPQYGKIPTEETRNKIRIALIGRKIPKNIKEKISLSLKGRCISEKTRKLHSLYWSGDKNPMKNYSIKQKAIKKSRETLLKNGNISKGQKLLYRYLDDFGIKYIPEYYIKFETGERGFFLDAFLPKQNLCIEYDGHSCHLNSDSDRRRDKTLFEKLSIKTLRIKNKEIFVESFSKNKIEEFIKK